jgi:hypothetical protein
MSQQKLQIPLEVYGSMTELVFIWWNRISSGFVKSVHVLIDDKNNVAVKYLIAIDDGGEFPEVWFQSSEVFETKAALVASL